MNKLDKLTMAGSSRSLPFNQQLPPNSKLKQEREPQSSSKNH